MSIDMVRTWLTLDACYIETPIDIFLGTGDSVKGLVEIRSCQRQTFQDALCTRVSFIL